jgi:hypothetical protein
MSNKLKKQWRERARPILEAYSAGRISSKDAVRRLGMRDTTVLLYELGEANLPLPMPPADEVEQQAEFVTKIIRGPS